MGSTPRWVIVALVAILLVALVAFARGPEHRRGDDVGAHPAVALALVSNVV